MEGVTLKTFSSIAKQLVDKVAEGVTDNEKDELQQLLLKYSGILSQYEGDLGRTDLVYHHIVTGDHKGIKQSGQGVGCLFIRGRK